MAFDAGLWALLVLAVIFAGVSKGGFGSGVAFASSSILALVLEPSVAIGVMLPLLMLMDVSALKPYWGKWSWADARLLVLGALPGVALGALFYTQANPDLFRLLIGGIALGFVAWQGALRLRLLTIGAQPLPRWAGGLAGIVAGFTSFISHAGGPPVIVYLLPKGLGKTTFQATTVLVFWLINISKAVPYAMLGIFSRETLIADLILAPVAVFGVWLGVKAHHLLPERLYFGVTYVALTLTGAKLVFDALT